MRVKVSMPTADAEKLKGKITDCAEKVEQEEAGESDWDIVRIFKCHPLFMLISVCRRCSLTQASSELSTSCFKRNAKVAEGWRLLLLLPLRVLLDSLITDQFVNLCINHAHLTFFESNSMMAVMKGWFECDVIEFHGNRIVLVKG